LVCHNAYGEDLPPRCMPPPPVTRGLTLPHGPSGAPEWGRS